MVVTCTMRFLPPQLHTYMYAYQEKRSLRHVVVTIIQYHCEKYGVVLTT